MQIFLCEVIVIEILVNDISGSVINFPKKQSQPQNIPLTSMSQYSKIEVHIYKQTILI